MTISAPEAILPVYLLAMVALPLLAIAGVLRMSFWRFVSAAVFITWAAMVAAVTLFPLRIVPAWRRPDDLLSRQINLAPLTDVGDPQFILNVVMLVPFGILLPIVLPRLNTLPRVACAGFLTSLIIEGSQLAMLILFGNRRWVETDDLIANTAGAAIGFLVWLAATSTARATGDIPATPAVQQRHDPVLR
jgi:glycopeptide antibiotics resistance protein